MESIIFKTLLHSLWQGLILALLTAAVLVFTHKSSASVRYNLLISCLILFSVSVFASFIYEWQSADAAVDTGVVTAADRLANAFPWSSGTLPAQDSVGNDSIAAVQQPWVWLQQALSFFNSYASTIVLLWLLVIAAKSVQLFAGLYSIKRIRQTKISSAGPYWENRVQQLAIQFGIYKMVAIVQSGLVNVPMVVGYFKPLILIPIGLLNNLSKEEVDAILCHELAHVKRRDYLVNILQSFMELLFFFNPAVSWLSGLIREERESCCDDLAVLNTNNNKAGYISALVSCEEFQMNKPVYAMAISGDSNQLVKRVKRMVSNDHPTLNKMEKSILAVSLLAVVTFSMAFSTVLKKPAQKSIQEALKSQSLADTEKEVPAYQKMISAIESGVLTAEHLVKGIEKGVLETENAVAKTENFVADVEQQWSPGDPKKYAANQARYEADKLRYAADKARDKAIKAELVENQARPEASKEEIAADQIRAEHEKQRIQDEQKRVQDETNRIQNEKRSPAQKKVKSTDAKSTITKKFVSDNSTATVYDEKTPDYILKDLIKDRLVKQDEKLSFEINQHQFLLNNKKLPKDVRKRYEQKYLKSADWIISYKQEYESK
ncbi:M56 family metallopeptidase [Pedobacter gandavensis]|uniref:M56 family metallopeptidase n=1 Tax=Pedobacter TaxID=84567 RepID=UPI001C99EB4E|nr:MULTISPECIES: M56 family metallopeptidase [Pedobacter]WGQ09535.1 M56 family metallopeptidase [Pedobacter gandavensis]